MGRKWCQALKDRNLSAEWSAGDSREAVSITSSAPHYFLGSFPDGGRVWAGPQNVPHGFLGCSL